MNYLWIREVNSKTFKSFLSGNEIEVGLYVPSSRDAAPPQKEIEIFYGEETENSYRAEVKRHKVLPSPQDSGKSYVTLSIVKI